MNSHTRTTAHRWLAENRRAIVVEVTQSLGSAPREAGTRMVVAETLVAGTVGGGHLELKAITLAREMLRRGDDMPRSEHVPLGPALGQCCGGAVTLQYTRLDASTFEHWPQDPPLFHLQLYGAGHVGRAIATLLCTLNATVDWIDEREQEFPPTTTLGTPWPTHIRQVCVDAVEAEVRIAPPGAFYLVLTHDHDLDLRITEAILRRGDFGFLGLIGSRTKRQRFIRRFEQRGIEAAPLARMTCPIGVPHIEGKEPEIIAMAVVTQLLQQARPIAPSTTPPAARTAPATTT